VNFPPSLLENSLSNGGDQDNLETPGMLRNPWSQEVVHIVHDFPVKSGKDKQREDENPPIVPKEKWEVSVGELGKA